RRLAARDHLLPVDDHIGDDDAVGGQDRAAADDDHVPSPGEARSRNSTAMRAATPFRTWSRIRVRDESATWGEISTPRFIGPGCMTTASGRRRANRASSRPKRRTYSGSDVNPVAPP